MINVGIVKNTMRTGVTHTIYYIMGPVEACETFLRIHHNCNPGLYVLILAALSVQRYSFFHYDYIKGNSTALWSGNKQFNKS